jgi:hypothetical protein
MIEQYKIWQLSDNPFLPLPPKDEATRRKVFVGRELEIKSILSRKNRPQGIFVVGMFGIGKSMLALEVLRQLKRTHVTTYVKFRKSIGLANSILSKLDGNEILSNDPVNKLEKVLAKLELKKPLIIVIDDLDKDTDIRDMQNLIIEARQVIELGCLVILLGHPVGVTAELSSAHDILYPVPLPNLGKNDLAEMIGRYLLTSRKRQFIGDKFYPFTPGIVKILTEIISDYSLTPRILNHACRLLLDQGATDKVNLITDSYFYDKWPFIAKSCLESLHQEDKEYFRKIHANGVFSENTRTLIKDLGGEFAEYNEIRKTISNLIQNDILIEKNNGGIREITPNPLYDLNKTVELFR